MIHRQRVADTSPSALEKPYSNRVKDQSLHGQTELQAVMKAYSQHLDEGQPAVQFSYPYERYRDREVKRALRQLFDGKCAYCESVYAGTQPMDVEHWRPKGEVHRQGTKVKEPGYYWLASTWNNLLPSCIDCNRARSQYDILRQEIISLGKANQFPIRGPRCLPRPDSDPTNITQQLNLLNEQPLLINPCVDLPEEFFTYDGRGVILPRPAAGHERERAQASIRVYALNRSDLVSERLAMRKIVDHRLGLIATLAKLCAKAHDDDYLQESLADLISFEIDNLFEMSHDPRPYAGMVREMLRAVDAALEEHRDRG